MISLFRKGFETAKKRDFTNLQTRILAIQWTTCRWCLKRSTNRNGPRTAENLSASLQKKMSEVIKSFRGQPYSSCYDGKNQVIELEFYQYYTQNQCNNECMIKLVIEKCNCWPKSSGFIKTDTFKSVSSCSFVQHASCVAPITSQFKLALGKKPWVIIHAEGLKIWNV